MAFRKLLRNERGNVAPTVALSLIGLVAAGGIAFDYARLAAMDTELQNAADQAALAAASQLDGQPRALERASAAAITLISNNTRFANDGNASGIDVTINPTLTFYATKADAEADANGFTDVARHAEAHFVKVLVNPRQARYALTPIVAAVSSGNIGAEAVAGLGSAICKVPPLMICNPTPGTPFDAAAWRGRGIRSVANQGNQWSAGGFGYLSVGGIDTPSTQEAMAFENPTMSCQNIDTGQVDTGNPTPAITAVNTRFDIYDYGGGTLSPCLTNGACPAALNVVKDVVRAPSVTGTGGNACKLHNSQGWHLAANRFSPRADTTYDATETLDSDGLIDAMGLPRDNCHYTSYGTICPGTDARLGNGQWARQDYWNRNHGSLGESKPAGWDSMTRYDVYKWEITHGIPGSPGHAAPPAANGDLQHGAPVCSSTTPDPTRDRRVFTVAIVDNCGSLHGTSTPAQIGSWIEIFFVEPGLNGRGNGETQGEIYMEVIGNANVGVSGQVIRRDTPYLVK